MLELPIRHKAQCSNRSTTSIRHGGACLSSQNSGGGDGESDVHRASLATLRIHIARLGYVKHTTCISKAPQFKCMLLFIYLFIKAGVLVPWHPCGGRKTTSMGICYPTLLRQRLSLAVLVDVYSQLVAYELPGYSLILFSQFTVWGSGITDVPLTLGFLNRK